MAISLFFPAVTGMAAQSEALSQVANNIVNLDTTGYKTTETMFYTLLGSEPVVKNPTGSQTDGLVSSKVDIHGVGAYDRIHITKQGEMNPTGGNYDVAINGNTNAFFIVQDSGLGDDSTYYTRDGEFMQLSLNGSSVLVNQNNLRVQGYMADATGNFSNSLSNITIDPPGTIAAQNTTQMTIVGNVPASGADNAVYSLDVYNQENLDGGYSLNMNFTKVLGTANLWELSFSSPDGTTSFAPVQALFSASGELSTPTSVDVTVDWAAGGSNTININLAGMTQYAGSASTTSIMQDGVQPGALESTGINDDGVVYARYSNNRILSIARLGLASFRAPNNLSPLTGNLYQYDPSCGAISYLDAAATSEFIEAGNLERSTTNLETEFSHMIVVQRAYGLNSTSFSTVDEMLSTVIDIKS